MRLIAYWGQAGIVALAVAMPARAQEPDAFETRFSTELSAGGLARVGKRDPGLIGGGNGGTGKSVNYDDGNLNYGRGLASLAVQGRSILTSTAKHLELGVEAVYFYDFLNADGDTDFHHLTDEARDRVGRGAYLNEAYVGLKGSMAQGDARIRAGNQRLRWSESPSFGQSIAPVNPVAFSRRHQPGNTGKDYVAALPMLSTEFISEQKWTTSAFYLFGFEPTEPDAAGSFLGSNDYYSPGARYLQLGQGSPLVADDDASHLTAATPFGSRVSRGPDRMPASGGQFGVRLETPELGSTSTVLAAYGMRVHSREPIVSVHTGTIVGLPPVDYTSSGSYFLEYPKDVTVLGGSLRLKPAAYTRLNFDYSMRLDQPLQIDDEILITAGLAPAVAAASCTAPASALCIGTLATLNRNPVIASQGGITAANVGTFLDKDLSGYERFDLSQWAFGLTQGLPAVAGASQWYASAEAGGLLIHGFRPDFIDASVSVRPDEDGRARNGFATRSAWGYRLFTRMEFEHVAGLKSLAPSLAWIQDVHGNAPITIATVLEGTRSAIAGLEAVVDDNLSARMSYRKWFGKGNDADRYTDRDFIAFSLTRKF